MDSKSPRQIPWPKWRLTENCTPRNRTSGLACFAFFCGKAKVASQISRSQDHFSQGPFGTLSPTPNLALCLALLAIFWANFVTQPTPGNSSASTKCDKWVKAWFEAKVFGFLPRHVDTTSNERNINIKTVPKLATLLPGWCVTNMIKWVLSWIGSSWTSLLDLISLYKWKSFLSGKQMFQLCPVFWTQIEGKTWMNVMISGLKKHHPSTSKIFLDFFCSSHFRPFWSILETGYKPL